MFYYTGWHKIKIKHTIITPFREASNLPLSASFLSKSNAQVFSLFLQQNTCFLSHPTLGLIANNSHRSVHSQYSPSSHCYMLAANSASPSWDPTGHSCHQITQAKYTYLHLSLSLHSSKSSPTDSSPALEQTTCFRLFSHSVSVPKGLTKHVLVEHLSLLSPMETLSFTSHSASQVLCISSQNLELPFYLAIPSLLGHTCQYPRRISNQMTNSNHTFLWTRVGNKNPRKKATT